MNKTQYLALLRGINVGGNNIIKMLDLKACFENMGFDNVLTYIQSGNVIFNSEEKNISELTIKIEKELSQKFGYTSKIVLITRDHLEIIIHEIPENFGTDPETYRYDVIFLRETLKPDEVFKLLKLRPGVDSAHFGQFTLYFSRLISKAGQSYLTKLVALPVYKEMTIRNWNTTKKLHELMNKGTDIVK